MPIKTFKPTTPSRRTMSFSVLNTTKSKPEKSLTTSKKKRSGRNQQGKITVRHRGGERRRQIRHIDYKQDKFDIEGKIAAIEYDPNRSALIALVHYADGEKRYVLLANDLSVGDVIMSSKKQIDIKPGNRLALKSIPAGTIIHNIELVEGKGGQIVKSAGSQAVIQSKEGDHVNIKLPSGEVRRVSKECFASVGQVGNTDHINEVIGKAGRKRWMGIRPTVRGKAMNPVDHPHGGGEGSQPIGLPHGKTPWGKPALGLKTRNRKNRSNKFIVKRRKK